MTGPKTLFQNYVVNPSKNSDENFPKSLKIKIFLELSNIFYFFSLPKPTFTSLDELSK